MIAAVLKYTKPAFWLEAGSMLGGSAIMTAKMIRELSMETTVVCVDPFTGDVNMWAWERGLNTGKKWKFLDIKNGRPSIYDRFRSNVVAAHQADVILPFTATAIVGFKLIARLHAEKRIAHLPNVIYLDSAHEKDETFIELQNAWAILTPRGVLMGDDWNWPAVRDDVQKFVKTVKTYPCKLEPGPWILQDTGVYLQHNEWVVCKP